jgi:hypothetical protein
MLCTQCLRFNKPVIGVDFGALALVTATTLGSHVFEVANVHPLGGDAQDAEERAGAAKRVIKLRPSGTKKRVLAPSSAVLAETRYRVWQETMPSADVVKKPAIPASVDGAALSQAKLGREDLPMLFVDDRSGDLLSFDSDHGAWFPVAGSGLSRWDKYQSAGVAEAAQSGSTADRVLSHSQKPVAPAAGENSLRVVQALIPPLSLGFTMVQGCPKAFVLVSHCRWRIVEDHMITRTLAYHPLVVHRPNGSQSRGALLFRIGLSVGCLPDPALKSNHMLRNMIVTHLVELASTLARRGHVGTSAMALTSMEPEDLKGDLSTLPDPHDASNIFLYQRETGRLPFQRLPVVRESVTRAAAAAAMEEAAFRVPTVAPDPETLLSTSWKAPPSVSAIRTAEVFPEHHQEHWGADATTALLDPSIETEQQLQRVAPPSSPIRSHDTLESDPPLALDSRSTVSHRTGSAPGFRHGPRLASTEFAAPRDSFMSRPTTASETKSSRPPSAGLRRPFPDLSGHRGNVTLLTGVEAEDAFQDGLTLEERFLQHDSPPRSSSARSRSRGIGYAVPRLPTRPSTRDSHRASPSRPLGMSRSATRTTLEAFARPVGSPAAHQSLSGVPGPMVNRTAASPVADDIDGFGEGNRRTGATNHVFDSTAARDREGMRMEQQLAASVSSLRPASPSGGLRFWDSVQSALGDTGRELEVQFLESVRKARGPLAPSRADEVPPLIMSQPSQVQDLSCLSVPALGPPDMDRFSSQEVGPMAGVRTVTPAAAGAVQQLGARNTLGPVKATHTAGMGVEGRKIEQERATLRRQQASSRSAKAEADVASGRTHRLRHADTRLEITIPKSEFGDTPVTTGVKRVLSKQHFRQDQVETLWRPGKERPSAVDNAASLLSAKDPELAAVCQNGPRDDARPRQGRQVTIVRGGLAGTAWSTRRCALGSRRGAVVAGDSTGSAERLGYKCVGALAPSSTIDAARLRARPKAGSEAEESKSQAGPLLRLPLPAVVDDEEGMTVPARVRLPDSMGSPVRQPATERLHLTMTTAALSQRPGTSNTLPHSIRAEEGGYLDEDVRERTEMRESRRHWIGKPFEPVTSAVIPRDMRRLKLTPGGLSDGAYQPISSESRPKSQPASFMNPLGFVSAGKPTSRSHREFGPRVVEIGDPVYRGVQS